MLVSTDCQSVFAATARGMLAAARCAHRDRQRRGAGAVVGAADSQPQSRQHVVQPQAPGSQPWALPLLAVLAPPRGERAVDCAIPPWGSVPGRQMGRLTHDRLPDRLVCVPDGMAASRLLLSRVGVAANPSSSEHNCSRWKPSWPSKLEWYGLGSRFAEW